MNQEPTAKLKNQVTTPDKTVILQTDEQSEEYYQAKDIKKVLKKIIHNANEAPKKINSKSKIQKNKKQNLTE